MSDDVILNYRRVGEIYTGQIFLRSGDLRSTDSSFENKSFAWIMARLAEQLQEHPSYGAVMERSDGRSPIFQRLDQKTIDILRTDPALAISAMHVESRVVIVRDEPAVDASLKVSLKVGHDTLADALGDLVYFRLKDNKIEHPFDGRWKSFTTYTLHGQTALHISEYHEHVPELALWISPWKVSDAWAAMPMDSLLDVGGRQGIGRYYLPRAWNESGSWVSHADLRKKYDEYIKEKENVSTVR